MEGQRNAWQLPGYTRIREIGDDGRVVLARRDADGAEVVLERLDARPGEEAAAGFRADAERLASADDPHLIRPRECVTGEAGAAIVRDAAEGEPLRRILGRAGPLGPEAALVLLHHILRGLAAAHRAGVAHRDLRPEHVLVAADGTARLTGFGVAHLARPAAGPYRPPGEEEPAGPAADLYAAAVTFAESLSGRPPRSGEDAAAAERVPGPLRDLVRYGTATRAGDGPESAEAFLDRLAEAAVAGYGPDWQERGRAALRPSPEPPAGRRPFGLAALSLLTPAAKLAVVGAVSVLTVLAILAVFAILGEPAETGSRAVPEVPVAETGPMTESPSSGSATPGHSPDRAGRSETTRPPEPARSRTSAAGGERVRPGDRPRTSRPAPSGSRTPAPTRRPSRTPTSSVTGSATPSAAPTTRPTSRPTSRPTPRPTLPSEPPTEGPGGGGTPTSEPERPTPAPEEPGGEPSTS